jgi:chaperonin GroEL
LPLPRTGVIRHPSSFRRALQDGASVAGFFLTTDAMVAELPKDEKPMGGHGRGGMGDMDM